MVKAKPTDLTARKHPAPTRWQEFEELCLDLWTVIWEDETAQKNGRQGDPQKGVDVFGIPKDKSEIQGVQCKGKTNYSNKTITITELDMEIAKAEKFEPPISHFYMATSGGVGSAIQEYANKLSVERKKQGKFGVSVMGWDWILNKMGSVKFIHIAEKYGYIQSETEPKPDNKDSIKIVGDTKLESGAMQNITNASNGGIVNQTIYINQQSKDNSDIASQVDYVKKLLDERKPGEALNYIANIYASVMKSDSDHDKYRLITNKASAYLQINETDTAAKLFIEAYQYHKKDEDKALCNVSLAHLLLGNVQDAVKYADQAIEINPKAARAYAFKIQALKDKKSLDELIELIPADLQTDADIAHALSFISQRKDDLVNTRKWIEVAYQSSPDDLEVKASLALILIQPHANTYGFMGQLSEDDKKDIGKAVSLFDDVIASYSDDEGRKANAINLYNRGAARRLLDDISGSIKDTEDAAKFEPDNLDFKKHLAQLYYENSQNTESIEILEELAKSDSMPEMKIALAERFLQDNQHQKAIDILESFIKESHEKEFTRAAIFFLLQIYIDSNKTIEAERLVEQMQTSESNSAYSLTLAGKLKRHLNDSEGATSYLLEAKRALDKDAPGDEKSILADELYSTGLYSEAAEVYESFINPKIVSGMSKKLLNTYYRAGEHQKAIKLCRIIQKQEGSTRYLTEMESSIYEDIGDLVKAQKVCKDYLKVNPDDVSVQLRLAVINYRKGDNAAVDAFLDKLPDHSTIDLQDRIQLALLSSERGRPRKITLDIGYEARRKYYSSPDAHLAYIQMLLTKRSSDDENELLDLKTVEVDTVAIIKNSKGEKRYFIIEDREEPDLAKFEYDKDSPIAKKLLNKKVGDKLEFNNEKDWEIEEIKSKYIYALHESMNNFSTLFPDTPGLTRMSFDTEKPEEGIKEFLSTIDDRNKYTDKVISMYKKSVLTVGVLANMLGNSELDTIYGIMEQPDIGIVSATGDQARLQNGIDALRDKPRIVLDLTGIISITNLKMTDKLVSEFGKPIVSQSILDDLKQQLSQQKQREQDGYAVVGKQGKNYTRDEITPDRVKKKTEYVQGLIDWINKECEILPNVQALKINAKKRHEMEKVISKTSIDTIILASGKNRILLSDDERLRMLGMSEFSTASTWTQPFLLRLQEQEIINTEEYKLAVIQLAMFHYRHTTIGPDIILKAAEDAGWASKSPFTDVISEIVRADITEESLLIVVTGFFLLLWRQPITYTQRQFLTQYVVSAMKPRSITSTDMFNKLSNTINNAFKRNPAIAKDINLIIQAPGNS